MGIRVRGQLALGPAPMFRFFSSFLRCRCNPFAMLLQAVAPVGAAKPVCALLQKNLKDSEDMQSTLGRIDTPSNPEPAIHDQVNFFNSDVNNIKHSLAKYGCH